MIARVNRMRSDLAHVRLLQSLYWSLGNANELSVLQNLFRFFRYRHGVFIYPEVNVRNIDGKLTVSRRLVLGGGKGLASYKKSDFLLYRNSISSIDDFKLRTGFQVVLHRDARLTLGTGAAGYNLRIDCYGEIRVGEGVQIAPDVVIRDSDNHRVSGQRTVAAPICIGNHVWIGMNSIVLKGVRVGDGAVIGAGAVVTHDVPDRCLVAGVPARVIRENVEWEL